MRSSVAWVLAGVVHVPVYAQGIVNQLPPETGIQLAAGQNVQTIARTAVSGAKTTMKCTSKTWAGSPLNVDNCHSSK